MTFGPLDGGGEKSPVSARDADAGALGSAPPSLSLPLKADSNGATSRNQTDTSSELAKAPSDPAVIWQFGWVVAVVAAGAVVMVATDRASPLALLAMLIIGLPALIGALWRPQGTQKAFLLGGWSLAAAAVTTLEGGVGAPLAVWCIMPAVATIVLDAPWLWGVGLSASSLLVAGVLQLLNLSAKAPQQPLAFWLSLVAVLTTVGGVVGAMAVARRRAGPRQNRRSRTSLSPSRP